MSTKESIKKLASDPVKGKVLSAQMLLANRNGTNPVIRYGNKTVKLVRITDVSVNSN